MNEFFFTLCLTESEHWIVEEMMQERCALLELTLKYYRKFKTGHVPGMREVKILGSEDGLIKFKKWIQDEDITIGNYHRIFKEIMAHKDKYSPEELHERLRYAEAGDEYYAKKFPNE